MIFDLDDTLFPTTWMSNHYRFNLEMFLKDPLSSEFDCLKDQLSPIFTKINALLEEARAKGTVVTLTNGDPDWVAAILDWLHNFGGVLSNHKVGGVLSNLDFVNPADDNLTTEHVHWVGGDQQRVKIRVWSSRKFGESRRLAPWNWKAEFLKNKVGNGVFPIKGGQEITFKEIIAIGDQQADGENFHRDWLHNDPEFQVEFRHKKWEKEGNKYTFDAFLAHLDVLIGWMKDKPLYDPIKL